MSFCLFTLKKFMKTELPEIKIHYIQESFKYINEKKIQLTIEKVRKEWLNKMI